jgi:hypothetical protein
MAEVVILLIALIILPTLLIGVGVVTAWYLAIADQGD